MLDFKPLGEEEKKDDEDPGNEDSEVPSIEESRVNQEKDASVNNTNIINTVSLTVNAAGIEDNVVDENIVYGCADDPNMPELEDIFKLQQVWTLIDLPNGKRTLVLNGCTGTRKMKEMDVKSAFLYGKIEEEVYVCQPLEFEDLDFPDRVYKVEKALYGLHQTPRACDVKTFSDVKTVTHKPLLKDADGEDVDEHLYGSMIRSLMYLTSLRPDIIYLKGQPKLGLWYPKDSPFDLVAYTDSDYAGASLDRKSITGGCQFLWYRLISWQCKKQTVVTNSTTEAEYIASSNLKNPVFHSKTKHIEIRHHFIRDSNEKKFIQMIKIHLDQNVADLLIIAFDVSRFEYLIASIGMLNL
ncbi:putative reverse transcriptase, RNA-dependent DNA polymerase [Tanacetum coccineum]|uniref:Reverse transcriptase, RNA-dependent DNA polymerase n=1 Tax=Tanacetum coccineum TaxID=301880 RepID=A0ABQ4ZPE9_9ASTR